MTEPVIKPRLSAAQENTLSPNIIFSKTQRCLTLGVSPLDEGSHPAHLSIVTLGSNCRAFSLSTKDTPDLAAAQVRASGFFLDNDAGGLSSVILGRAGGSCPCWPGVPGTHTGQHRCACIPRLSKNRASHLSGSRRCHQSVRGKRSEPPSSAPGSADQPSTHRVPAGY